MNSAVPLNIYQIEKYAQDHAFDTLEFIMINKHGNKFNGHFLDAYFGMIRVPEISEGFIRLENLKKEFGDDYFAFIPLAMS